MLTKSLQFASRAARGLHRRINTYSVQRVLNQKGLGVGSRIKTYTDRSELEALFKLAQACPPNAKVLEIGSYLGASTCYLAAGLNRSASIVCVDTWENQTMPDGIRDTMAEFESNLQAARSQLVLIRKSSSDVAPKELNGPFNLIFLDGDHSYKQTRWDFDLVAGLVAENGVLAFHDSLFFEGVSRVLGEALASGKWQIGGNVRNLFWIKPAKFAK